MKISKNFFISLAIFTIVMLLVGVFYGCTRSEPQPYDIETTNQNRFQTIYKQPIGHDGIFIVIDKETNVKYLFIKNGYGAGLTKLEE